MNKLEKRQRIAFIIIMMTILFFSYLFISSIFSQKSEFKEKEKEINRLQKEIKSLKEENKQLNDPEYIKNEFRKKYNLVEDNEKIINFPESK